MIKNIVITEGKPGTKELCMSWRGLKCYQRLELLAGPACDVVLVDFDNTEVRDLDYSSFTHSNTCYIPV